MRWSHVLNNNHFPRKFLSRSSKLNRNFITLRAEMLCKSFRSNFISKNHRKIDIPWQSKAVTFSLHSPEHIAVIVVRMNHLLASPFWAYR